MLARPYDTHPLSVRLQNTATSSKNEPCLQTLLLAGALDCKAESYPGQRQRNSLQCSPVHGSGPGPTPNPNRKGKDTKQTKPHNHHQTPRSKETEDQQKDTTEKRGGEKPQKDRNGMAAPINDRVNSIRGQWTLAPGQQERLHEYPTLARGRANHTQIQKQARAKRRGERRQISGGRTKHRHRDTQHRERRKGARRQQRKGGGMARENQRGYPSALPNVPWGSWNIKDEYLSAAGQSNTKPFQSGVEGDETPHRAKPLVPQ